MNFEIRQCCFIMATIFAIAVSGAQKGDKNALYETGGLLDIPPQGCIIIVNCQNTIAKETFDGQIKKLADITKVHIKSVSLPAFDLASTPVATMKKEDSAAAVFIIDSPYMPMSLIAPEGNWGIVNISHFYSGNSSKDVAKTRAQTEFMRVTLLALGAWIGDGASLLKKVSSPVDLDALSQRGITLFELRDIMNHMLSLGITRATSVTYRQAYLEGWAPMPTNQFQRAIVEQIKADKERGPTNPLTIPPPKKK